MSNKPEHMQVVSEQSFVTLHYRIRLESNKQVVVSTFEDKPATFQLGAGQLAQGLERCLLGMHAGQRDTFVLPASKGYGEPNTTLFRPVSKSLLNQHAEPGTTFEPGEFVHFPTPQGGQFAGTVVEDQGEHILFDFNHPLAGKALSFEVQLVGVL